MHGNAEPDLPDGVLYYLAVEPGGETYLRTDQDRSPHKMMACMAEVATFGRERYATIPRTRGSLEEGSSPSRAAA